MFLHEALRQTLQLEGPLKVLDLCAAPGGKTTLLLSLLGLDHFLVANEVIQSRVGMLRENLEKWGHSNYLVTNHDPADFRALAGFFDLVTVDAPCSGEGLFRKDPQAAGEWSTKQVMLCAARQERILGEAQALVKPGGLLVYSTCTFNPQENDDNVEALIAKYGFEPCPLHLSDWGISPTRFGYQFFPHLVRGEGFYMAVLRKKSDNADASVRPMKLPIPKDWQRLPPKEAELLTPWLNGRLDEIAFFVKPTGEIHGLPHTLEPAFLEVTNALRKRSFGLKLGDLKHKSLIPSHTLALSHWAAPTLPGVELSKAEALRFLKKEPLWEADWPSGWVLARYQCHNLGWLKVLDNRSNNYLPNEWRIRMRMEE